MKINVLILAFLGLCFVQCKQDASKDKLRRERPNIVFIMSDDHAYQAISAYSNKLIETPNIDRIAQEGMLFTNASVTNSICAPSRAVILTGKHSHINGKIDNLSPFDTTNITFPQLLQKDGYQTAMFGKLHFGNAPKGFDEYKILPGQGDYYNPKFLTQKGDTTITGYVTDIITDLTLDWLQHRRVKEKPFLLMYLHKAPHRSWLPAPRHYKEFTQKTFPLPNTLFDSYSNRGTASKMAEMNILNHMILNYDNKISAKIIDSLGIKDRRLFDPLDKMTKDQRTEWNNTYDPINTDFAANYPSMNDSTLMVWKYQRYMQDYLGTIAAVDENVGRVLNYLEEENLDQNTIVIYTSDQGFYLGEHGWFDKRFMYEESFRTPLLIKWPNAIKAGITEDEMVQNLDFAQTFLELAEIEAPRDMQGKSLVPLFKDKKESWDRDAVYYHYYEFPAEHHVKRHYGLATKDFKLMHYYYDIDEWELYDRRTDTQEMVNVYGDPKYKDIVSELKLKLTALQTEYGDSEALRNQYIQIYKDKGWINP
ncbi:sulfatase family protein [Eudoraea chungangensis]|uniref:sulfatase family protein n=1 Tax=Eudoraea chungangensis TaxID=1481905 RepID=UPI0023EB8C70|nr:sulfatase [Eudoraea chungangensis]